MSSIYHNWPFEILPNGNMIFMDPSKPDRFFMEEGDQFRVEFKDGHTVLVKVVDNK
jgi:formylmethanofuran dehydrogenase subunit D